MTAEEFQRLSNADPLTLTVPERVKWLRVKMFDRPGQPLSHDKFAARVGAANRQTVMRWENGTEPTEYADKLAELAAEWADLPAGAWLYEDGRPDRMAEIKARMDALDAAIADVLELNREAFAAIAKKLGLKIPALEAASAPSRRGRASRKQRAPSGDAVTDV